MVSIDSDGNINDVPPDPNSSLDVWVMVDWWFGEHHMATDVHVNMQGLPVYADAIKPALTMITNGDVWYHAQWDGSKWYISNGLAPLPPHQKIVKNKISQIISSYVV